MVDKAWKLAIEAQDCQQSSAGTPVVTPSVIQLPYGISLTIDSQTRKPGSVILLKSSHWTYDHDKTLKYA